MPGYNPNAARRATTTTNNNNTLRSLLAGMTIVKVIDDTVEVNGETLRSKKIKKDQLFIVATLVKAGAVIKQAAGGQRHEMRFANDSYYLVGDSSQVWDARRFATVDVRYLTDAQLSQLFGTFKTVTIR